MPSRGRPDKCLSTFMKWGGNNIHPSKVEWILSLDYSDPDVEKYLKIFPEYFSLAKNGDRCRILYSKNRSAIDAINNAAKVAVGNIFIVVSDDSECDGDYWYERIERDAKGKDDWIMKVQDGIQPWIITQPIMDRKYYDRFGYIYHPDYEHMFCDTELTCVADITGRKITSKLLFPHKHYSVTKEKPDAIARKNDATWAQGEKLFLQRYAKNFDLPPGGKIQDNGMINWLKSKNARA